jgi:endo-alpha-1,4-polygalactosaminidase (GH114 family)
MGAPMRRGLPALAAAALAVALLSATGGSQPAKASTDPASFAFAIGNGTLKGSAGEVGGRYEDFDLVVVDGEEASAVKIAAIQATGATVLGYLSVGTIEKWRGWFDEVKRYRLKAWQDWKDEWFADTSKAGFRKRIANEIAAELLQKGFDGLFLDNTDMVETDSHRAQRKGMGKLIEMLDSLTHGDGKLLYAQNGGPAMLDGYPQQDVAPLAAHFDGWNREDVTWTYDFDHHTYKPNPAGARNEALQELEDVGAEGLVTTATDYVELDDGDDTAECDSLLNAESAGALEYVADIGLTAKAVAANPFTC